MSRSELRLFISSTFRDLHAEREHLVKRIFPEIRALCRERGVLFTEIDLRWGISEEDGQLGKILGPCLEEIDRCRPYFLGIIGDRYGWVPSLLEFYKDPDLGVRYPWLEESIEQQRSIMEIECRYGALDGTEGSRALFYARESRPDRRLSTRRRSERDERTEGLLREIDAAGFDIRRFRTPSILGELVYDDLVALLERDFPLTEVTDLELERSRHQAFAASRRRGYVPRVSATRSLDQLVSDYDRPVQILQGPSGCGKSALLAYWAATHRRRHPDDLVIEYYVGLSADRPEDFLAYLVAELDDRFGVGEEREASGESLVSSLPDRFAKASTGRVIILLDAVDQFPEEEAGVAWIPEFVPAHVSIVISTTSVELPAPLHPFAENVVRLDPLRIEEREAIVIRFLGEYHKQLPSELVTTIATNDRTDNPIYLRTLLEELRLFGNHDRIAEQVAELLGCNDVDELFSLFLGRLERDFHPEVVRSVLRALGVASAGLTERELVDLTALPASDVGELVGALDYHLVSRQGALTFFHAYLRRAVEHRYLDVEDQRIAAVDLVVEYFSGIDDLDRLYSVLPYVLLESDRTEQLSELLKRPETVTWYLDNHEQYRLLSLWRESATIEEIADTYRDLVRIAYRSIGPTTDVLGLAARVGSFMTTIGALETAEWSLRFASRLARRIGDISSELDVLSRLGTLYYYNRRPRRAVFALRKHAELAAQEYGETDDRTLQGANDLAAALYAASLMKTDREVLLSEAEELLRESLLKAKEQAGSTPYRLLSEIMNNLAAVLNSRSRSSESRDLFEESWRMARMTFGEQHPETVTRRMNFGLALRNSGDATRARVELVAVVDSLRATLGSSHELVARALLNLGSVYALLDETDKAVDVCREAYHIRRQLFGENREETWVTAANLAIKLHRAGVYDESEALYRAYVAYRERTAEENPRALEIARKRFSEMLDNRRLLQS